MKRLDFCQTLVGKVESGERRLDLPELLADIQGLGLNLAASVTLYESALAEDGGAAQAE